MGFGLQFDIQSLQSFMITTTLVEEGHIPFLPKQRLRFRDLSTSTRTLQVSPFQKGGSEGRKSSELAHEQWLFGLRLSIRLEYTTGIQ